MEAERKEEEERVLQERAIALAQLQTEAENVPVPWETAVPEIGRPVTQVLFQDLAREPVDKHQQKSSRDTPKETPRKNQRRGPEGIRKSRMRKALQRQDADRKPGRVAATYDQLGWMIQDPNAAATEGPSSTRQAAREDTEINTVRAATAAVQDAFLGHSPTQLAKVTPASGHDSIPVNVDFQTGPSGPRPDAEANPVQTEPEAVASMSVTSTHRGSSGGMSPGSRHGPSGVIREGRKIGRTPKLIRKTRKNQPTLRDINRADIRKAAIDNALEAESTVAPSPALGTGRKAVMLSVSPWPDATECPVEHRRVRFDDAPEDSGPSSNRERLPRPAAQYEFRGLSRGTLTDPGGNSSNVAADEPWPPGLSLPGTEPQHTSSDCSIAITFYIYERGQWKVAHVSTVDTSEPSSLEQMVWRYKKQNMFVYNLKMQTVSVATSFLAATADGANALLLIPRDAKQQMDGRQPIQPPVGREQSKRIRR